MTFDDIDDRFHEWCHHNIPMVYLVESHRRPSPDVPVGTLRVTWEYYGGVSVGSVLPASHAKWNAGDRDVAITRELYAAGLVEPHVTWASDLGWRVTDAGKKAGLK